MVEGANPTMELMPEAPPRLRELIVSGMRWTFWLSLVAAPLGYGTSVLLARTGPEVIGTYGLLMVYIGVVSSLFYFGGDAVVIKFVPELEPEQRLAFLGSYFLVITAALIPWLAAASFRPRELHYLFGRPAGQRFELIVLYLSPIYIAFSLIVAALKSVLEIRWAQVLLRLVTAGSFVLYALLFFARPILLRGHYTGLIWGIYLGLTAMASVLGLVKLMCLPDWPNRRRSLRFFLPRGFWIYALSLEQGSALGFLSQRLDLILILNFGGLTVLGKYVAIITLAEIIRVANRFFLDSLLPSLTNLLAAHSLAAASQLVSMNLRILFAVNIAATCGLAFLVRPITALLGPQYGGMNSLFVLMIVCFGLSAPGAVGGTLLTSVGKQQHTVWVAMGQLVLYVLLFLTLWPRWQLSGAVAAYGVSTLVASVGFLLVAKRVVPIEFSAAGNYALFALITLGTGWGATFLRTIEITLGMVASAASLALFLLLAGYSIGECQRLAKCFFPVQPGLTGALGLQPVLQRLNSWRQKAVAPFDRNGRGGAAE